MCLPSRSSRPVQQDETKKSRDLFAYEFNVLALAMNYTALGVRENVSLLGRGVITS